jgi:hypothetical protein
MTGHFKPEADFRLLSTSSGEVSIRCKPGKSSISYCCEAPCTSEITHPESESVVPVSCQDNSYRSFGNIPVSTMTLGTAHVAFGSTDLLGHA